MSESIVEDLVARLRYEAEILPHDVYVYLNPLLIEAAEEIERLRGAREPKKDERAG